MATIDDKQIIDDIIAGKYEEDGAFRIVQYTNAWGNTTWGVCFEGDDPDKYAESKYVRNPTLYWEKK